MTSSENDPTSWFDSKLDDLQKQIDRLGKGDVAGAEEPDATAMPTTSAPAVRTSTRPEHGTPTPEVGRDASARSGRNGSIVADDVHEARNTAAAPAPQRRPAPTATPRRRLDTGGGYRLGVDVGGTFTDLLLIEDATGQTFTAKVPSTPDDSSRGVLNGIERICAIAGIEPSAIGSVMHGTTVATNTVLTGSGARVGLVTTKGYRQTLQIARSYVPGGLGGWVIFNKTDPLAPLELTLEADERMGARGEIVDPLNEETLRRDLRKLQGEGIEAMTVSLLNAYTNGVTEQRVRRIIEEMLPGIPVSISSEVVPEMYEYERTETTVVNSYIRPVVSKYVENLKSELDRRMNGVQLHILRSDGGLASAEAAKATPVNLLMSGPAGGVSGAIWMARQAGFDQLLTFDMGGTSTDVALIQDGVAQTRRETRVADVTVRASSVDVRTVGAGGGSIAYVPELTGALRVGPQSAGAEPGPAAYGKGGSEPTVTDANVVLGYLPANARLGGDMKLDVKAAEAAVSRIAKAMDMPVKAAAEGIIDIVNENMFGALRLVSVEKGFDPRDFALIGFGGAGPLHANALGKLMNSWPVIVPPGPGVLCAHGDATTRVRDEASRTFVRRFDETSDAEVADQLEGLMRQAAEALNAEGVSRNEQTTLYQIDLRYHGQGMQLTVDIAPEEFAQGGLREVSRRFDAMHEQLFTFRLDAMHESYNLRALVQGRESSATAHQLDHGNGDPSGAAYEQTGVYVDGREHAAKIFDRLSLKAGDRIAGPAVVTEMDSTTMILNDHVGKVDEVGNILITPAGH